VRRLRLASLLALPCLSACGPNVRALDVAPSLQSCLDGRAVTEVRVTGLGDFPPGAGSVASAMPSGTTSLTLPDGTRVVEVDGAGPAGLAAFGRTPPLDLGQLYGARIAVAYGPLDGLCPTGKLNFARAGHRATSLGSGDVLISGGVDVDGFAVSRLELYSPLDDAGGAAATFRIVDLGGPTALDARAALGQAVAPLPDGGALITGGAPSRNGKADGIAYEGWTRHGPDGIKVGSAGVLGGGPRAFHTATPLPDGRVLLAGGCQQLVGGACAPGAVLGTTTIYDPASDGYTDGPTLLHPRWDHAAAPFGGGVLISGGLDEGGAEPTLEQIGLGPGGGVSYDAGAGGGRAAALPTGSVALVDPRAPAAGAVSLFTGDANLPLQTLGPAGAGVEVTALQDGGFLVAGGTAQPLTVFDGRGTPTALAPYPRLRFAAALVGDGSVLLSGGASDGSASSDAFVYLRSPVGPYTSLPTFTFDSPDEPFVPRRPDRAVVAGGRLRVTASAASVEFALAAGMIVGDFTVDVGVGLGNATDEAMILLGVQSATAGASSQTLLLSPGVPITFGGPGCNAVAPTSDELPLGDVAPVRVSWHQGKLTVGTPTRTWLDCALPTPIPRGGLGLGAVRGTALFDNWTITR
jgi:hypothetical protein